MLYLARETELRWGSDLECEWAQDWEPLKEHGSARHSDSLWATLWALECVRLLVLQRETSKGRGLALLWVLYY